MSASIASSLGHPIGIVTERSQELESFLTALATEAYTASAGAPAFQYHPSFTDPVLGSPLRPGSGSRSELRSCALDEVIRNSYYSVQEPFETFCHPSYSPAVGGNSCDSSPFPTCLGLDVPADPKLVEPAKTPPSGHSGEFHAVPRPVYQGHKCRHSAQRLGDQETHGHICRYTCPAANCRKCFAGYSERNRHIRSRHRPPTLGCRKCDYRQSRKDVFREHCKKRHPGEVIEDLLIRLVQVGRRPYEPATSLRTGGNN